MAIETLDKQTIRKMGSFDNAGRFYLDDIFRTESSKSIRSPSRSWPLSVWNHCKTIKFRLSLDEKQREMLGIVFIKSN